MATEGPVVLDRVHGCDDIPELTGFEGENLRNLVVAKHYLRKTGLSTLKPLLPLLLQLKGKPYRLNNHFPFEPFFRTRMPKTTLLKTGRQVSKCLWGETAVTMADGTTARIKDLAVGDEVLSYGAGRLRPNKVTSFWDSGTRPALVVETESGRTLCLSPDHRMLVTDGANRVVEYRRAGDLYRGDYLLRWSANRKSWERVASLRSCGPLPLYDIEVEVDHNFLANGLVSHNSTSLAAQGILFSAASPYFSTLYVTPLYEMIRRFSHNYVREFLENSPIKRLFVGKKSLNNVLQRTFSNGSSMYFSYAFLDAERTRGIPADKNVIDEVQDMNYDFLQIIHETLSGSPYGLKQYAGTPKSLDNTMEKLWQQSSQAEWVIRCRTAGCGHFNIPSVGHDLWDMIGPWHRDITVDNPGVVCSECRKPLDPQTGRWVHAFPERRWSYAGYHVPQMVMPMHYGNQEKWGVLTDKKAGKYNTTPTTFLNECCGESCDSGSKLITETDIKGACVLPWRCKASEATRHLGEYTRRILAVDWGGGGGRIGSAVKKDGDQKRLRTSFTSLAVLGMRHNGKVDVLWGHRSLRTHQFEYEAALAIEAMKKFKCSHLAHDYSGAGTGRLVMIKQAGLPLNNIINISYHGHGRSTMLYKEPSWDCPDGVYSLHRSVSLVTTCQCIKYGLVRFFQDDYETADNPGLLRDFLSLIEEKVDSRISMDNYVVVRNPNQPDDFAHAVNYGCATLWWMTGKWPNLAEALRFQIPEDVMKQAHPQTQVDWDDV
jgi:hypothetical protein